VNLKKQGAIFLNGVMVVAPVVVTVYVVVKALVLLDSKIGVLLPEGAGGQPIRGLGVVVGVAGIYVTGLLARTWILRWPLRVAETVVERIPLVKSLYSAVRDLLQFLGGTDKESRGKPCVVRVMDGKALVLGLVTRQEPVSLVPGEARRMAVYLPMSYQLGGYTVYVPPELVVPLEGTSVEELLKLCLTAGVGQRSARRPTGRTAHLRPDGTGAQAPPADRAS
jgi:uncharacterized membrane protein